MAAAIFAVLYVVGSFDLSYAANEANLSDEWLFNQIMRGERLSFKCAVFNSSNIPSFMLSNGPSRAANITCDKYGNWNVKVNSQYLLADQYALFAVAKAETAVNYTLQMKDTITDQRAGIEIFRMFPILLIIGTAVDTILINLVRGTWARLQSLKTIK